MIAAGAINIHLDQDVLRASVLHQPSLLHQLYDPMVALTLAALTTMATLAALFALYAMGTLGGASPLTQSYTGLTAHEFSDPYNRSVAFGSHGRRADLTHLTRTLLLGTLLHTRIRHEPTTCRLLWTRTLTCPAGPCAAACTLGPLLLVALLHVIVRAAPAREETVVRGSLTGGWSVLSRLLEKNDLTFRACPASGLLVRGAASNPPRRTPTAPHHALPRSCRCTPYHQPSLMVWWYGPLLTSSIGGGRCGRRRRRRWRCARRRT